jgi:hypothetical protein
MEAAALGCVPVHSNEYAPAETLGKRGSSSTNDIEAAAIGLVKATQEPFGEQERDALSAWALEKYDYEKLTDEWWSC